jgi:carboxypeptidase Q
MRITPLLLVVSLSAAAQPVEERYRETAARLIDAALKNDAGYKKLAYLCDRIGPRLSGSKELEAAVRWTAAQMKAEGFENVATPLVKVPHWVRGRESAELVEPRRAPLTMLGLGGSVGTPPEGITAEVLAVSSFDDLTAKAAQARGKIVLYNVPWKSYGFNVAYRSRGASEAAKHGAVAALVRTAGLPTGNAVHTGMMSYRDGAPKIPVAAVSHEDAALIGRLIDLGEKVQVRLTMGAQTLPEADSANVIGEIRGSEKPDEVVVMGGHLDSWDAGTGAHDDAVGCIAPLEALAVIRKLGLRPRRTLRVVLFTNEENGLRGGPAYHAWAGDAVKNHVAAIEMDSGAEKLSGFGITANDKAIAQAQEIGKLLKSIGGDAVTKGGGGADIGPLMRAGVPGLGVRTAGERYMEWHHAASDTLDKVDPQEFRKHIAALAVMGFVLADMPERLGQ